MTLGVVLPEAKYHHGYLPQAKYHHMWLFARGQISSWLFARGQISSWLFAKASRLLEKDINIYQIDSKLNSCADIDLPHGDVDV